MKFNFLKTLLVITAASNLTLAAAAEESAAESTSESLVQQVGQQVESLGADQILCFANSEFKSDVNLTLITQISTIQNLAPGAVSSSQQEECVNVTHARRSVHEANKAKLEDALLSFSSRFQNSNDVDIEVMGRKQPFSIIATNPESADSNKADSSLAVSVTWRTMTRAAVAGAAGAGLLQLAKPVLNKAASGSKDENKGTKGFLSIGQGAIVGVVADLIQRMNGATDESKIARTNFTASMLASLVNTRDPNFTGVAVIVSLANTRFVDRQIEKLASITPKKLDPVWALAMIGGFAILSHNKKEEKWINGNHAPAALGFGAFAYHFANKYDNETTSFIIMNSISFLDELCDGVSKVCKGRFSTRDLFANALGAFVGVKLATWLPPGMFLSFYYRGAELTYQRQW